jgi:hypothetical protein
MLMTKIMNNTKTIAIVAVLTAATLVVGLTVAAATPSAFAGGYKERHDKYIKGGQDGYKKEKQDSYKKTTYKKERQDNGIYGNGNTVTVQAAKQNGQVSGHDNTLEQEAQNLICTHPSSTCVSEGSETNATDTTDNGDDGHGHPGGG